jgi:phosphonopyruvate decarboxylase
VAIAVGIQLTGGRPCVFLQNSGLGNAVNPLTSLCHALAVPVLLIIGWRGEPDVRDEPQHELMGRITEPVLSAMEIAHRKMQTDEGLLEQQVSDAVAYMDRTLLPFALLVPKGTLSPLEGGPVRNSGVAHRPNGMRRDDAIGVILSHIDRESVVVSTTGKTSRELERDWDRPRNLYVVGSMGCASSIALGVALGACKSRPVVVLDGDGAALMRLEALTTIGRMAPANLLHIVLDNGVHDSTGGQPTGAEAVDLIGIAQACGYTSAFEASDRVQLKEIVSSLRFCEGPVFVRVDIVPGADSQLGRPALGPRDSAQRFREAIRG